MGVRVLPFAYICQGAVIGDRTIIGPYCYIEGDAEIGAYCHIGTSVGIYAGARIRDHVFIGPGAQLTNCIYPAYPTEDFAPDPLLICEGAMIGAGACILAGNVIGPGATVAMGAVVRENVPGQTMFHGIAAREFEPYNPF